MASEVLIVDDEQDIRSVVRLVLEKEGWVCHEAASTRDAEAQLDANPDIEIVFMDIRMPGESGLQYMAKLRERPGQLEVVVMTGHGGVDEAVEALRLGAKDFLLKPFSIHQIRQAIGKCCSNLTARRQQDEFRDRVLAEIRSKDSRIDQLARAVDSAQIETLKTLAAAAEKRDNDTGAHVRRIGSYAEILARRLGWSDREVERIGHAAQLHDLGKIGVPDRILLKPGPLSAEEAEIMKRHTEIGYQIIGGARNLLMRSAAAIAWCHHERWDGTGYPRGLRGEDIPMEARIVAVGDVYDALRSERPYKRGFAHDEAISILLTGDGRTAPDHFDPRVLEALNDAAAEFDQAFVRWGKPTPDRHDPEVRAGIR